MTETLVGRLLAGKYEVIGDLGHGGMADVYAARDTVLQRRIALKLIARTLARDPGFIRRFENEARLLAALDHEHIVRIFDVGTVDGRPFLAMQYLDGQSLSHAIYEHGPWSLERAVPLLHDIASALDYAHSQHLVHRDVKPANIMVAPTGKATLTDFGVAKALSTASMTGGETVANTTIGTVAYMSPEQMQSSNVGPSSDIYSLGVVAYELLTGRLPFEAESTISMITRVLHDAPVPANRVDPRIPHRVAQVLDRALSKQPVQRYPTARAFAEALAVAVAAGKSSTRGDDPPAAATQPAPERRGYTTPATRLTPALVIYLIDLSASMSQPLGARTRIDVVKDALQATIRQMVFRSTRGRIVAPRYQLRVLGYSNQVYDLLGGRKSVDELAASTFNPDLTPLRTTDTARAFAEVERILQGELDASSTCPAPIVCHLTDGEFTGDDPEPIVERIKALRVADGNVLVENIFVSDQIVREPIVDPKTWSGISADTPLISDYARQLRRMSSPLPESYRGSLLESGFRLARGSVMLLPGTTPELVRLAFQVSGMTGAAAPL